MKNEVEACESCTIPELNEEATCDLDNRSKKGVVLYSIDCPLCKVLEKKLTQHGIPYEKNTSIEEMTALGIEKLPILSIAGQLLDFSAAIEWLNKQKQEDPA